ncbi:MAG: DMT family transporter [Acetobacteraceae bacterium]|jgi:drug/metabolite transporter (DMT)-like permease
MPRTDDPLRGIALSVGSTVLFSISDATSKVLTAYLPVVEIAWLRYVIFVLVAAVLVRRGRPRAVWPRSPALQVTRGLCLVGSSLLFVYGLRRLPLAEASTISFVSPVLTTMLSVPLLGEQVGIRRWAAVVAGLAGVVVVMRPGLAGFQPAALFPLGSALCWALALVITRRMADIERPSTTVLWSAGVGALVLSLLLPFDATWPTPGQMSLAVLLGVLASVGQSIVVVAYRHAPASVLAPFSYAQLVWAGCAGWLVFGTLPDHWTLVGATIIAASGVYTAHRERVRSRFSA